MEKYRNKTGIKLIQACGDHAIRPKAGTQAKNAKTLEDNKNLIFGRKESPQTGGDNTHSATPIEPLGTPSYRDKISLRYIASAALELASPVMERILLPIIQHKEKRPQDEAQDIRQCADELLTKPIARGKLLKIR